MKRLSIIICLFVFKTGNIRSQDIKLNLLFQKEIQGNFNVFSVDELGNIYVSTSSGQIKKYNSNLDSIAVFNEVKRYGQLHSMHTENPLRPILYFKNFNTIILLDRMMQSIQKIDLRKANLYQVSAVASSYDNRLWVFDQQNSRIKKINFDGSVEFESTDLRLVFDERIYPIKMIEHQGALYLLDSLTGVYVFDYYGGFKKRLLYPHTIDIESWGDALVGIGKEKIWIKKENEMEVKWMGLPQYLFDVKQLYFNNQIAYSLVDHKISLYSFSFNK